MPPSSSFAADAAAAPAAATATAAEDREEAAILSHLSSGEGAVIGDTYPWSQSLGIDHDRVVGAVKSLLADSYVEADDVSSQFWVLEDEGRQVLQHGSPEARVLDFVRSAPSRSCTVAEIQSGVGPEAARIGVGNCMKNKWIQKSKDDPQLLVAAVDSARDRVREQLAELQAKGFAPGALDEKTLAALRKRKLVRLVTRKSHRVRRGPSYRPVRVRRAADLTREMLESGSWKTTPFKPYNFATLGERPAHSGYLHPLLKVRAEFRKVLLQMGFEEMPANRWAESSFWNFDALFQPQSHPARDAHDTFFLSHPARTLELPAGYRDRVGRAHEDGAGTGGSIGHRYRFDDGEARKNLLRTHTTAVSSRMLYELARRPGGGFRPARYFSVDRVFRNETTDATHLCEFHQVEGLVADYDLSLGDLIGTIETFFRRIGISEIRFKPAYNPYTEPSMEIFGYHPDLKKWTEIGNSGMFRPEMLLPMGLPENVRVIAWGLSLERPTMIKYRIKNIRDLFGHKVELARTRAAPICRFEPAP